MKRKQLVSSDEAVASTRQHVRPCADCPWALTALHGWLGGLTADDWLKAAHGDARIECHTLTGAQCAGAAIYRRNVCKMPRAADALRLSADRVRVFTSPADFKAHHEGDE